MLKLIKLFGLLLLLPFTGCNPQNSGLINNYVRVSSQNPRYFEYSNGNSYIPVGINICFERVEQDEKKVLDLYEERFKKLSANGGNLVRIWLSAPFFEIEHAKAFEYDQTIVKRIDHILKLAEQYDIKLKFCLEHFRRLSGYPPSFPGSVRMDKPIYSVDNGGPLNSMDSYFQSSAGNDLFLSKIRFLADRYSNNPTVFGWELWNEINAVSSGTDITLEWTRKMLPKVQSEFPNHLIMQTLGSFDNESYKKMYKDFMTLEANDVAQVHRYLDLGAKWKICHSPMDTLTSNAVVELLKIVKDKPVLLSETGAVEPRHAGPSKLYDIDKKGILLHDLLFAPFFSGAAGPGQSWHWQHYIEKNNLWWHFQRFSEVIKGYNPIKENPVPAELNQGNFRVYALNGNNTVLIWIRDIHSNWETELTEKKEVSVYKGVTINLDPLKINNSSKVSVYDPWEHRWGKSKIINNTISLPEFSRSIVIKIKK